MNQTKEKPKCSQCGGPLIEGRGGLFCEQHGFATIAEEPAVVNDPLAGMSDEQIAVELKSRKFKGAISSLMTRYYDAYLVARATVGIGTTIKAIGIIVAVILCVGGFLMASNNGPREAAGVLGVIGIALGVVVGILFYVIGVLVSTQGQILKAILDTAVTSSSLLSEEQRIKIMSL